ncbi:flagellar basal body-associated FliL family protein [Aquibacillus sediminis]|uniref:flagellar basal body-associated FliL family protein n=1 Tax=Aquibacillus sediminis TaxID=2574734 RepID=UPI001108DECA|nr:flagellar basal body-associated FliL family protein [Aquibacillus sediminis]
MKRKGLYITMMLSMVLLGGVLASLFFIFVGDSKANDELTINDKVEYSYEMEEISTDLNDGSYVRMQVIFIGDSKDAREELDNRGSQLKNLLIKQLSSMDAKSLQSDLSKFENTVKDITNGMMEDGKVIEFYITEKLMQT